MRVCLNIGMEGNPFTPVVIKGYFDETFKNTLSMTATKGIWHDLPEKTFVVSFDFGLPLDQLAPLVTNLCWVFKQEAIAMSVDSGRVEKLVYNEDYKGEKVEFDGEYFIKL